MIYVLELENSKYYVGFTNNLEKRLYCHFNYGGSCWTKIHKPVKVIETLEGGKDIEKLVTLKYMRLYGWENIRGAAWTQRNLKNPPKDL
jgi:predicted GIY-YIG superfamily endonuclease